MLLGDGDMSHVCMGWEGRTPSLPSRTIPTLHAFLTEPPRPIATLLFHPPLSHSVSTLLFHPLLPHFQILDEVVISEVKMRLINSLKTFLKVSPGNVGSVLGQGMDKGGSRILQGQGSSTYSNAQEERGVIKHPSSWTFPSLILILLDWRSGISPTL